MNIRSTLIVLDGEINRNGRRYTTESFKEIPLEIPIYFDSNAQVCVGRAKLNLNNNKITAEGEIWDKYAMSVLSNLMIPIFMSSMGTGNINEKGIVENFNLEAVFLNVQGNSDTRTGVIEVLKNE